MRALLTLQILCSLGLAGSVMAAPPPTPQLASPESSTALPTVIAHAGFDGSAIDAYLGQPRFAHASWGIAVRSLETGRLLYAYAPQRLLQTASTAKLFTAATVLDATGPQTRITTRVIAGPIDRRGHLNGPLILQGRGDPSLGVASETQHWAEQLAQQLADRGLRQVDGDLIADDSYFSGPAYGAGWEAEDLQTWFGAPTSALSVNENVADLTVEPAHRAGQRAGLVLDPKGAIAQIDSQLMTAPSRAGAAINLYRAPGSQTLEAFGRIALHSPAQHFKLALPDPAHTAGLMLAEALRAHGIGLAGRVQVRHWPQPAPALEQSQTLAEVQSPPLAWLLQQGLKRSQNLYLQNLLQIAGVNYRAEHTASSADDFVSSADAGVLAVQALLNKAGIDPAEVQISDGTGMSRRSLASPGALSALLVWVAQQSYAEDFRAGLPVAGVDGTLAAHFHHSPAADNLQAKTGSMSLVHCLAGYVTSLQGQHLAFAIMLNNYVAPAGAPSISHDVDQVALLLTRDGVPELVRSSAGHDPAAAE